MSLAVLFCAAIAPGAARADPEAAPPGRLWADIGLGYGFLNGDAPVNATGGGLLVDLQLGMRLGTQWRVGFNLGGIGIHPDSRNYDPYDYYSSVYRQAITNEFLVVEFEPFVDHGWWLGAGGGKVLYDDKGLQAVTGNERSGNGTAGLVRLGYDWYRGGRSHLEAVLSYEAGRISLNAPFTARFNYSVVALSAHYAYH